MNERNILQEMNNDFLVRGVYSFQNEENLYLVMEYMKGGDVGSVLASQFCFNNATAKFALAHIVAALEYL